jgi:N-acetylglucosamine-6-sulfatase
MRLANGVALAALVVLVCFIATSSSPTMAQQTSKPNIILILTDDMALQDAAHMPKLKSYLIDQGTTFQNAFVTNATCCPSRASILRGQYTHNHQVLVTNAGYQKFSSQGHESSTIAT